MNHGVPSIIEEGGCYAGLPGQEIRLAFFCGSKPYHTLLYMASRFLPCVTSSCPTIMPASALEREAGANKERPAAICSSMLDMMSLVYERPWLSSLRRDG